MLVFLLIEMLSVGRKSASKNVCADFFFKELDSTEMFSLPVLKIQNV